MLRHSRMLALGSSAPRFSLPTPAGRIWSLDECAGARGLAVAFICNHCPFVQHIAAGLAQFARDYQPRGVSFVAISSNDVAAHPEDAPQQMAEFARLHDFSFPYLYDESQHVALAYEAVCTPDLFLFDHDRRLIYRGQFDGSRPHTEWDVKAGRARNMVPVTGADLRAASEALLAGRPPLTEQIPSAGCSIKWKPENEPDWS